MLARSLIEIRHRIVSHNHRGISLSASQLHRRIELAWIVARIAAREIHAEGIACLPGDHLIGARYISPLPHTTTYEPRMGVQIAPERKQRLAIVAMSAGLHESHPK